MLVPTYNWTMISASGEGKDLVTLQVSKTRKASKGRCGKALWRTKQQQKESCSHYKILRITFWSCKGVFQTATLLNWKIFRSEIGDNSGDISIYIVKYNSTCWSQVWNSLICGARQVGGLVPQQRRHLLLVKPTVEHELPRATRIVQKLSGKSYKS